MARGTIFAEVPSRRMKRRDEQGSRALDESMKPATGQKVMSHRGIALMIALLVALAFCTGAWAEPLDLITNSNLKAYAESELAHGAPSIPVASRALVPGGAPAPARRQEG